MPIYTVNLAVRGRINKVLYAFFIIPTNGAIPCYPPLKEILLSTHCGRAQMTTILHNFTFSQQKMHFSLAKSGNMCYTGSVRISASNPITKNPGRPPGFPIGVKENRILSGGLRIIFVRK